MSEFLFSFLFIFINTFFFVLSTMQWNEFFERFVLSYDWLIQIRISICYQQLCHRQFNGAPSSSTFNILYFLSSSCRIFIICRSPLECPGSCICVCVWISNDFHWIIIHLWCILCLYLCSDNKRDEHWAFIRLTASYRNITCDVLFQMQNVSLFYFFFAFLFAILKCRNEQLLSHVHEWRSHESGRVIMASIFCMYVILYVRCVWEPCTQCAVCNSKTKSDHPIK